MMISSVVVHAANNGMMSTNSFFMITFHRAGPFNDSHIISYNKTAFEGWLSKLALPYPASYNSHFLLRVLPGDTQD
jgi:hypothetical protein